MILDIEQQKVIDNFHTAYLEGEKEIWDYFEERGVDFRRCLAGERTLNPDCLYLISVPSLNLVGNSHMLVAETNKEGGWWLYDPNQGREDRKYYVTRTDGHPDTAVLITSWEPQLEFKIDDILYYRSFCEEE
jgi:hypothetical protein